MPQKAAVACMRSGCPGLVRNGICSVCGPTQREYRRLYDERRGSSAKRGYGTNWQRNRAMFLRANPLCADCAKLGITEAATDPHHIIKKRDGGSDEWDNLMPLCHEHHSMRTARGE